MTKSLEERRAEGRTILGSGNLIALSAAAVGWVALGWFAAVLAVLAYFGGIVASVGYDASREGLE